jgi:hypothetical protein
MTKFRVIHVGPACRAGLRGPAATRDQAMIQSEDASPEITTIIYLDGPSKPAFASPNGESPARQARPTRGGSR